ncbi:MAG: flagellar basal body-associated FliL family protein [Balneolaceae bacterium]|nr:flagellar basal body-associated FliL family protein [Balneolaceae bacterium]
MATEAIDRQDEETPGDTAQVDVPEEGNGSFFSRYGKIFLMMAVLLGQAGGAYGIVNTYYEQIHTWISSMSSQGGVYKNFENIIINPAESAGESYLILTVAVELYSESQLAVVEKNSVKIVDKINRVLSQRSSSELANLDTREEIKRDLGLAINQTLEKKVVRNLFFTKYVLQ